MEFNHKPQGSLIGSGDYKFRHYGDEKIADLTGTTWVLNEELETGESITYNINFSTSGDTFTYFYAPCVNTDGMSVKLSAYTYKYVSRLTSYYCGSLKDLYTLTYLGFGTLNYEGGHEINNNYRTISITGGTDATNKTLIDWLYANAVLQS